jgi:hypothetical protein
VCRARSPRSSILKYCACPLHANGACACGRRGSDRSALLRARGMSGSACWAHRAGAVRQQGCCGALRLDPCTRCDYGVLKGHPSLWGTVRGYRRGTSLPWVRRSTAERPSPLRVCSWLNKNELTGSVPSSLSTLTKLTELCVPPSCQRRLRVRPTRVGSVGSAPSARHVGGCMSGASSGAMRQQGCCGSLGGGPRDAM